MLNLQVHVIWARLFGSFHNPQAVNNHSWFTCLQMGLSHELGPYEAGLGMAGGRRSWRSIKKGDVYPSNIGLGMGWGLGFGDFAVPRNGYIICEICE